MCHQNLKITQWGRYHSLQTLGGNSSERGVHPALLKEATNQQNAICEAFVLLPSLSLTALPTGLLGCSWRMWALNSFLRLALGMPGPTAGQWLLLCPLASKIDLAPCQLLFRNWFPPALWVLVLVWFHLNLEELNYLLTATKPVSGRPGIQTQMEKETTQGDLMLWDRVGTDEEERCWKGREGKGFASHPFQVCLRLSLSCGHKQK